MSSNPDPNDPQNQTTYYSSSTAIADLGSARFDHDVAAIDTQRDTALLGNRHVHVPKGQAPRGFEAKAFAWSTLQYTTEDKDAKEEAKEDLHGGQLHRLNRAAKEPFAGAMGFSGGERGGFGGGGRGGGRGGRKGGGRGQPPAENGVRCAYKPEGPDVLPLAKGFAEELSADMFWDKPIV
jgi:hypothetical protein